MTQTKRDTLLLQVGGWGMRMKLIQKFCLATKSEIQFRISNTINQNILSSFYLVKKCFVFYGTQRIFRATDKFFTSVYDLSSSFYIEVYTSQLPDMVFEFLNFENL